MEKLKEEISRSKIDSLHRSKIDINCSRRVENYTFLKIVSTI